MPNVRLIVDGQVVMDSDTTNWARRPPAELASLTARGQAKPWHKAAMIALADAVTSHRDIEIVVATTPAGWNLTVSHQREIDTHSALSAARLLGEPGPD